MGQTKNLNDSETDTTLTKDSKLENIELFNFGYAPLTVIEKFQEFCSSFSTLSEAVNEILKRECLLTRKYKFIVSTISYQMLVEPTEKDTALGIQMMLLSLQRFTRKGKYCSVASAVEELLFSPYHRPETCEDKSTWTEGNVGGNYSELSYNEQLVIEQIADTLMTKLASNFPQPKKRRATNPSRLEPKPKRVKSQPITEVQIEVQNAVVKANKSIEPLEPFADGNDVVQSIKKSQNSYLCLNPSLQKSNLSNMFREPVDSEVAVPLKNFLHPRSTRPKSKPDMSAYTAQKKSPTKSQFLRAFLSLKPKAKSS